MKIDDCLVRISNKIDNLKYKQSEINRKIVLIKKDFRDLETEIQGKEEFTVKEKHQLNQYDITSLRVDLATSDDKVSMIKKYIDEYELLDLTVIDFFREQLLQLTGEFKEKEIYIQRLNQVENKFDRKNQIKSERSINEVLSLKSNKKNTLKQYDEEIRYLQSEIEILNLMKAHLQTLKDNLVHLKNQNIDLCNMDEKTLDKLKPEKTRRLDIDSEENPLVKNGTLNQDHPLMKEINLLTEAFLRFPRQTEYTPIYLQQNYINDWVARSKTPNEKRFALFVYDQFQPVNPLNERKNSSHYIKVYDAIQEIHDHGKKCDLKDVIEFSLKLKQDLMRLDSTQDPIQLQAYENIFTARLHSMDDVINQHRYPNWQKLKVLIHAVQEAFVWAFQKMTGQTAEDTHTKPNFFGKTTREKLVHKVEESFADANTKKNSRG